MHGFEEVTHWNYVLEIWLLGNSCLRVKTVSVAGAVVGIFSSQCIIFKCPLPPPPPPPVITQLITLCVGYGHGARGQNNYEVDVSFYEPVDLKVSL